MLPAICRTCGLPFHEERNVLFDRVTMGLGDDPMEVNNGYCVEWAESVAAAIPGAVVVEVDDPPDILLHACVHLRGRYFDAEVMCGVADWRDLPYFARQVPDRIGELEAHVSWGGVNGAMGSSQDVPTVSLGEH